MKVPNTTDVSRKPKVGMISLGCAKNLVDAEIMLGSVLQRGMEITSLRRRRRRAGRQYVRLHRFRQGGIDRRDSRSASAARTEQAPGPKTDRERLHVAALCEGTADELPEVDAFIGLDQVAQLGEIVEEPGSATVPVARCKRRKRDACATFRRHAAHVHSGLRHAAFPTHAGAFRLREDRRGLQSSVQFLRDPADARQASQPHDRNRSWRKFAALVAEGVREINLISQDTTYYGMDLWDGESRPASAGRFDPRPDAVALLREIQKIDGDFWVRLLYTHPAHWSDELIETHRRMRQGRALHRHAAPAHPRIDARQRMRRETSREHIENLIAQTSRRNSGHRACAPPSSSGFPARPTRNSSPARFHRRSRFERLGIFKYSQEDGSRAAKMPGQIPAKIKNARYRAAMSLQQKIAHELARRKNWPRTEVAGRSAANRADRSRCARRRHARGFVEAGACWRIRYEGLSPAAAVTICSPKLESHFSSSRFGK